MLLTPDTILLLWFVAVGLIALSLPFLMSNIERTTRHTGRHRHRPGRHRQSNTTAGWWGPLALPAGETL